VTLLTNSQNFIKRLETQTNPTDYTKRIIRKIYTTKLAGKINNIEHEIESATQKFLESQKYPPLYATTNQNKTELETKYRNYFFSLYNLTEIQTLLNTPTSNQRKQFAKVQYLAEKKMQSDNIKNKNIQNASKIVTMSLFGYHQFEEKINYITHGIKKSKLLPEILNHSNCEDVIQKLTKRVYTKRNFIATEPIIEIVAQEVYNNLKQTKEYNA
jgi:hypothetical protein